MVLFECSALHTKIYLLWVRQRPENCYSGLFTAVLREICVYIGDVLMLVQLHSGFLRCFSVVERLWKGRIALSVPFHFSREGRYLSVHFQSLIYTGGLEQGRALTQTCAIALSGKVLSLPNLAVGRYMHGLAAYRSVVYVFGGLEIEEGDEKYTKSCESLSLSSAVQWTALPDQIHHRVCYNPCVWRDEIWLCGGRSPTIEAFSPASLSFRLISLPFPDNGPTLVFQMNSNLVVFSRRSAVTLSVVQGEVQAESKTSLLGKFEATMEVVTYQDLVWVMQNDKCVGLDGFSGITVEIVK